MFRSLHRSALLLFLLLLAATLALPRGGSAQGAGPIFNPATGHWYEAVPVGGGVLWPDARAAAAVRTHQGNRGYLATLTSASEDAWVSANLPSAVQGHFHLGGMQPPGSPEPAGNWQWITGEPWTYTNWNTGEPNNTAGGDILAFWNNGRWNDGIRTDLHGGYVVEYGSAAPPTTSVYFLPPVNYAVPFPHNTGVADMDGDDHLDLLAYSRGSIAVLYGRGDGGFLAPVFYPVGPNQLTQWADVEGVDVDNDGRADLVAAVGAANEVVVLLNGGGRAFGQPARYRVGQLARGLAPGDFNEDGAVDLAVSNHDSGDMSVLLNGGNGAFLPAVSYACTGKPGEITSEDFNGDGHVDLAVSSYVTDRVRVFAGDGLGRFTPAGDHIVGSYPAAVVAADFNNDGKADLATSNTFGDDVTLLLGNGAGGFARVPPAPAGSNPHLPAAADLDGDGDTDLAVPCYGNSTLVVMKNDGKGVLTGETPFASGGVNTRALSVGDFNEDGRPDVVVSNENTSSLSVFLNDTAFPAMPAFTGVRSRWEADGDAFDSAGGNHGALVGTRFAGGVGGSAFFFDGQDDGVNVADAPNLRLTRSLSVAGWVFTQSYAPSAAAPRAILFRGDNRAGLDPYRLVVRNDGKVAFEINSGVATETVTAPLPLGRWVHVAATLDETSRKLRLYVDGRPASELVTSIRPFRDLDPGAAPGVGIGNVNNRPNLFQNLPFQGMIDDLQVYGRALGLGEVALAANVRLLPPADLIVSSPSATSLQLSWSDRSYNEDGFRIERRGASGGYTALATVGPNVTTYTDAGLPPSTGYVYRVRAFNRAGSSPYSNEAAGVTGRDVPPPPNQLTATVLSQTSARLEWRDRSRNEAGFKIERRMAAGSFREIAITAPDETTYQDNTLVVDTEYVYRVRAFNGEGDSDWSNEVRARSFPLPPDPPADLGATSPGSTEAALTWQDGSANETSFRIERRASNGLWFEVGFVEQNFSSFRETGLTPETAYTYRVRAFNPAGGSAYTNTSSVTTLAAPTGLTARVASDTSVALLWQDRSAKESGYLVERKAGTGPWTQIARLPMNSASHISTGLTPNTAYSYRVRAYSPTSFSSFTPEALVSTLAAPGDLKAAPASHTEIGLTWADRSVGEEGFVVERRKAGGNWVEAARAAANTTAHTDTGLLPNSFYVYRVRAFNTSGQSAWSPEAGAVTLVAPPPAPAGLQGVPTSSTAVRLTWTRGPRLEDGYRLERRTGTAKFALVAEIPGGASSFTDQGLRADTVYWYRLQAFNAGGSSPYSTETEVRTPPAPPATPTGFSAALRADGRAELKWRSGGGTVSGFRIERAIGTAAFTLLAEKPAAATSHLDADLKPDTRYRYQVKAFNAGGESAPTAPLEVVTPPLLPAAPTSLRVVRVGTNAVDLAWRHTGADEDGFKVERSGDGGASFAEAGRVGKDVFAFKDEGVQPDRTYHYRVRAFHRGGESAPSNGVQARTPVAVGGKLEVPELLGFGRVKVGKTKTLDLEIRNGHASEVLEVTVGAATGPFRVTGGSGKVRLAPGAVHVVKITFRPTRKGRLKGSLGLRSTDPARATVSVSLKGRGK